MINENELISEEGNKFKNNTIKQLINTNEQADDTDETKMVLRREVSFDIVNTSSAKAYSRYHFDFEEIGELGHGGFGAVFKVKNKLDGNLYAIKKIHFKHNESKEELRKIILEVKLLSNLNHPNIVRYYQAWFEETDEIDEMSEESGSYSEIEESEQENTIEWSSNIDKQVKIRFL